MKILGLNPKKFIIFLLTLSLTAASIGCKAQKKEIQRLFLVMAVGIDKMPDDSIQVTMQVLNPSSSQSQGGEPSGPTPKDVIVLSGIGDTFYDAVYDASKTMSRVQHFGHTKYIVMSDAFAREGIGEFIDSLSRIEEMRLNTPILVTKGIASDLVKVQTPKSPIPAIVVENLFLRQESIGFRPFSYTIDLINSLGSETSSPVAAVLELSKPNDDSGDKTFTLSGTAIFKKDKLIGYLNDKETRGVQWTKGNVQMGTVTFQSEDYGKVTCEIFKSSRKVKPIVDKDSITINIDLKVFSDIRRIGKTIDPVKHPEILDEIARLQDDAIKKEIQLALNTARDDYDADIFDFGEAIHRANPKEWNKIKEDWPSIYQNLNVTINVSSIVRSAGLTNKSIK
jgi:spore germination protein KC